MLIYKKTKLEMEQLQDEDLKTYLENICTYLKDQATTLVDLMGGAK